MNFKYFQALQGPVRTLQEPCKVVMRKACRTCKRHLSGENDISPDGTSILAIGTSDFTKMSMMPLNSGLTGGLKLKPNNASMMRL